MQTTEHRECDIIGCTAEGHYRTVTGDQLCEHCHDERLAAESACMAGNGASPPLAFVSWWRRLRGRR